MSTKRKRFCLELQAPPLDFYFVEKQDTLLVCHSRETRGELDPCYTMKLHGSLFHNMVDNPVYPMKDFPYSMVCRNSNSTRKLLEIFDSLEMECDGAKVAVRGKYALPAFDVFLAHPSRLEEGSTEPELGAQCTVEVMIYFIKHGSIYYPAFIIDDII